MSDTLPSTAPISGNDIRPFQPFSSLVRVDVAAKSHPGLVRPNNEDQFFVAQLSRALETMLSSLPSGDVPEHAEEVNYVMIVADGMGGHAAGEMASRLTIRALASLALDLPYWILKLNKDVAAELERRVRDTVQQVGAILYERGHQDAELRGMGSTLTIARSLGRDLLVAHVGDSRAYLFRAGQLHRLTKDHTYAQMLVDCGRLHADDIAISGVRHILTNALGGSTEHVEVDVDMLKLETGDRLLLCSDGLTDLIDDEALAETLAANPASATACDRLVQMALDRGGRDNVTVIVAAYTIPGESD
jgi:protein phosphatase